MLKNGWGVSKLSADHTAAEDLSRKARALIGLIRLYQRYVSPLLGYRCRFYPSCSHYAVGSLELYSLPKAVAKIGGQLLRCQPWHPGGFDYP